MSKKPAASDQVGKLDRELVELLNRRAAAALQAAGADDPASIDQEILARAAAASDGPLSAAAVAAIFRELLSGIHAAQRPVRAAYLGPEYTYSHLAAIARFGQSAELVAVATIRSVFEEVERGQSDFGVVPI